MSTILLTFTFYSSFEIAIMKIFILLLGFLSLSSQTNCSSSSAPQVQEEQQPDLEGLSKAYFASGCFWCVEAIFESVRGVKEVISGYSGGAKSDANYNEVSAGRTDHAEAVEVYFDSDVDYQTLLEVFFGSHDPTTLNRQGPDRGAQYRSAIFYQNQSEKELAESYIAKLTEEKVFDDKIVTEVVPLEAFYQAEDYHQDYERHNPNNPYVRSVSIPRLKRFQAKFPHLLKENQAH